MLGDLKCLLHGWEFVNIDGSIRFGGLISGRKTNMMLCTNSWYFMIGIGTVPFSRYLGNAFNILIYTNLINRGLLIGKIC